VVALAAAVAVVLALVGWMVWRNWVPSAPGAPSAQAVTATSVELRWSPSTAGPGVDQYVIERNGSQVGSVASSVVSWVDRTVTPDSTYRYVIIGGSGSKRSAPSAEVAVRTLPATPDGLTVTSSSASAVTITWSSPPKGPAPEQYLVVRDDLEVATVPGTQTSYESTALVPATSYRFVVIAVTGANRSDPSAELVAQTLPAAPTALKASKVTTNAITVQWTRPTAGPPPDGFVVLRDDTELATVSGTTVSYTDSRLAPATTYRYSVLTVTGGLRSDPSPVLAVKTRTPPVASAHLDGTWPVEGKVTKVSGSVTLGGSTAKGQTFSWDWDFTSKCTVGPCAAVVSGVFASHPFTVTVTPSNGTYKGSTLVHISHCQGLNGTVDVKNTLRLAITVNKAALTSNIWSATSWKGTLTLLSPYTSGGSSGTLRSYCPASSLTASVTASK
jgi:chitodextrinase